MVIFLCIWSLISTALLVFSAFYCLKFAKIILSLEEKIEEALDILDPKYKSLSEIAEKPIFFDSVEIRQVIFEINSARQMILYIANNLSNLESLDLDTFKSAEKEEIGE